MCRFFTILVFNFIYQIGSTQIYFSFIDTSSVWRDEIGGGHDGIMDLLILEEISIGRDTFFNDHQYFELIEKVQEINCCWIAEPAMTNPVIYYIREDSLKHVFISNTLSEQLFYDFNLESGDSLPLSSINADPSNFVFSVDSILIGSNYRRRFNIANHDDWDDEPYTAIIEGIGSTNGLRVELLPPFESYNQLICFTNQGITTQFTEQYYGISGLDDNLSGCDLIYVDIQNKINPEKKITIFPNPVVQDIYISIRGIQGIEGNLKILNQQGSVILEKEVTISPDNILNEHLGNLTPGVYFLSISTYFNCKFVIF